MKIKRIIHKNVVVFCGYVKEMTSATQQSQAPFCGMYKDN